MGSLFEGSIDDAAREHRGEGFDGFNLSDIYDPASETFRLKIRLTEDVG